jgi:flagellar basal-body rod protein FlgB
MPGIQLEDAPMRALATALNGLATRQSVIANNLANIDTPGFKASEVNFAQQLSDATQAGSGLQLVSTNPQHLSGTSTASSDAVEITLSNNSSERLDGNNVDSEQEMESLSETVLQYEAAARVVSLRMGMLRNVINGGGQ